VYSLNLSQQLRTNQLRRLLGAFYTPPPPPSIVMTLDCFVVMDTPKTVQCFIFQHLRNIIQTPAHNSKTRLEL
jgi:hypothetical protein